MRRILAGLIIAAMVLAACSNETEGGATSAAPGDGETTPATSPTTAATSTTTPPTTTSHASTTSTTAAVTSTAPPETTAPGFVCPDLSRTVDDADVDAVQLAAWSASGEAAWEIPIGNVIPAWAVWSDLVVLGFPDGELVGIDVATCESWSITLAGGIADLAVTEQGVYLAINGGTIAAFSGDGFGAWRHQAIDSVYRFVGDNAGIAVFVDQFGDVTGIDTSGEVVFVWGGVSDARTVAMSETFVYRATGAEVAARPVGGGDVVWANELAGIEALFAAPGTLLAQDAGRLHALEPQTGDVRWSVRFDGEIAGPAVLAHDELHLAARHDAIGFDTLWHLDPADGSTIFRGMAPPNREWFPEMDDALLLQIGEDGTVVGLDMLQQPVWTIDTGANRISRFTQAEIARGGAVVTLSFDAERF